MLTASTQFEHGESFAFFRWYALNYEGFSKWHKGGRPLLWHAWWTTTGKGKNRPRYPYR